MASHREEQCEPSKPSRLLTVATRSMVTIPHMSWTPHSRAPTGRRHRVYRSRWCHLGSQDPPRWVRATGTAPPARLRTPGNRFLRTSVNAAPVGMQCQRPNLFSISSYFALKWMLSNCLARSLSAYTHSPSRQEAPCPRPGTAPPGRELPTQMGAACGKSHRETASEMLQ